MIQKKIRLVYIIPEILPSYPFHMFQVRDPLATSNCEFFSEKMNQKINKLLANTVPDTNQLTLRTSLPLANCEPLAGMRSYTCPDFTAFSLLFKTGSDTIHQVSKFSNGTNSFSFQNKYFHIYTKSSGFEETASGRFSVSLDSNNTITIESSDLENLSPKISIGSVAKFGKNWALISQLNLLDAAGSLGIKFQPCGHMHAGFGFTTNPLSAKKLFKSCHSSLYFETHKKGVFGCIGTIGLDGTVPHNFSLGLTSRMDSVLPRKITAKDTGGIVEIPSPVVGMNYDLFHKRFSGFIDFQFTAISQPQEIPKSQPGPITLKLRMGISIDQSQWPPAPAFSCNLSATESE